MRAIRCLVLVHALMSLSGLLLLASGCGGDGVQQNILPEAAAMGEFLPWPPQGVSRQASVIDTVILGKNTTLRGGGYFGEKENSLLLEGTGDFPNPWAVYSVWGLGWGNELEAVAVDWEEKKFANLGDTTLWIGLANQHRGTWEWFDPGETPWNHMLQIPAHYRNADGEAFLSVVLDGLGEGWVHTVLFSSSGNPVGTPENLTALVNNQLNVELDWDDVTDAIGYNVYRATRLDLGDAAKINFAPLLQSDYYDMPKRAKDYFYYATALRVNESGPSNVERVWVPSINLPAPQNLRVRETGDDWMEVEWDWPHAEPSGGFRLYIDIEPGFVIDEDTEDYTVIGYKPRRFKFLDREGGVLYYIRMCARAEDGRLGHMTDEFEAGVPGFWTWRDVYTLDTGRPPVRAMAVDGQLAACFFDDGDVRFAIGAGDSWDVSTVMGPGYYVWIDMAYGGGNYLITAYHHPAGDAWAATGTPGDWDTYRIHGDGGTGMGHLESGWDIAAGASDGEFAVAHTYLEPVAGQKPQPKLMLHTRPISGGNWTTETLREPRPDNTLTTCFGWVGENLHVLSTDANQFEVRWYDRDEDWAWYDIRPDPSLIVRRYYDLHWFNGEWYSPGFDPAFKILYIVHGDAVPWSFDPIAISEDGFAIGSYARLAVEGDEAIVISYGNGRYYFGFYSDDWKQELISVPGVEKWNYGPNGDVVLLDGSPYLFFQDEGNHKIKVAKGTPPVF